MNQAETPAEREAIRRSVIRSAPFGHATWQKRIAVKLGWDSVLSPRGRPKCEKVTNG